ncbi:GlsB/YeaQ/YmgE family stress response membrane protein [Cribrihabitans neustonicus]|uniref:GlsB/YeaQ/YmgE family stress response membrane protein n=1 Tax=Cribrihabitans neustonicus TaxID=1429085 RepID=UPI003B5CAE54
MSIIALVIIGAAAGFLATRLMRVETDIVTTVVIGMAGALIGGLLLRALLAVLGFAAGFLGALLGALALIWFWQRYVQR